MVGGQTCKQPTLTVRGQTQGDKVSIHTFFEKIQTHFFQKYRPFTDLFAQKYRPILNNLIFSHFLTYASTTNYW